MHCCIDIKGAWASAVIGLAFNMWMSIGSILYGKSPLVDNLPVGKSCTADNFTSPVASLTTATITMPITDVVITDVPTTDVIMEAVMPQTG